MAAKREESEKAKIISEAKAKNSESNDSVVYRGLRYANNENNEAAYRRAASSRTPLARRIAHARRALVINRCVDHD